jgi:EAL domain-containing protein (putative c-di-GMP-specific phosphodiesterase class I)
MGQLAGFHQNLEICAAAAEFVEKCVRWFQPIVGLRTGLLSGFEVLARWQHPSAA